VRRPAAVALALGLLLGACGGDDGGRDDTAPASTTTSIPSAVAVRLGQLLIRGPDLADEGYRPVVVSRAFSAQRASRIRLCDEDIRAELRIVAGRQSRFSDGSVEVSHTVTSGGDTNDFLDTFEAVVADCPGPWTEPALPTGGGPVTREIVGTYPVPDVGVGGAGAIIRSHNALGSTDTIVVVLVRGAYVSSLSVSGPEGSDFDVVDPAIQAAATRLLDAQSPAGP
jgi:hypothetical protein